MPAPNPNPVTVTPSCAPPEAADARVAELARRRAPAGAYVRSQALAGREPDRDAVALNAARATALAVAPPRIGACR